MIVRLLSVRLSVAVAAAGCITLQVGNVCGQNRQHGTKIEFSDAKTSEVATNLSLLGSKKDRLREFEDDFDRSLKKAFSTESSMDGVQAPNYRPPARQRTPSKRAKKLEEERRNWVFMDPNEVSSAPTAEELFHMPEYDKHGVEKTDKTPLEKFYERMDKEAKDGKSDGRSRDEAATDARKLAGSLDDADDSDESGLPGELGNTVHSLRKLLNSDANGKAPNFAPGRSSISDIFGLGDSHSLTDQTMPQKSHFEDFPKFYYGGSTPADSVNPLGGLGDHGLSTPMASPGALSGSPLGTASFSGGGLFPSLPGLPGLPQDTATKGLGSYYTPPPPSQPAAPKLAPLPSRFDFQTRKGL
jgi:hypothetical protein